MSELKLLAEDILNKLQRHQDFPSDIKPHLKKAKELGREINDNSDKPISVEGILVENEHKAAEKSIDEMVEATVEDTHTEPIAETTREIEEVRSEPVIEEIEEAPIAEETQEEELNEEVQPKDSTEEDKEKSSFFDKFE